MRQKLALSSHSGATGYRTQARPEGSSQTPPFGLQRGKPPFWGSSWVISAPRPKKLRPGEVAAAIGSTYKAISHWLYRYSEQGVAPKAEQEGGWVEFSWGDVAALAITKYLVDLGMPVVTAYPVAT